MGRYYRMSKKVTEDQVKEILRETLELEEVSNITDDNIEEHLAELEQEMFSAAEKFEFERAAKLRDTIAELKEKYKL